MPSSMIFAGLVGIWLLILVPAVARHRQEVARPTVAALSGRVLERPRRRQNLEVDVMDSERTVDDVQQSRDDADEYVTDRDDAGDADRRWERPPPRYRPGRGGYDPQAAALAAGARYAFRQRVVLAMLVIAVGTGVLAAVAFRGLWWAHAAVDLVLVGYLVYLRRQVRLEESIRDRRAARMAGIRRPSAAEDPELDDWDTGYDPVETADDERDRPADLTGADDRAEPAGPDRPDDLSREDPERVTGIGEPLPAADAEPDDAELGLPRLQPVPPPALPPGTALVEVDDEDPGLPELDGPARPDYRRAVGE